MNNLFSELSRSGVEIYIFYSCIHLAGQHFAKQNTVLQTENTEILQDRILLSIGKKNESERSQITMSSYGDHLKWAQLHSEFRS